MKILVLNSGSSSIKYQLFLLPEERVIAKGLLERIGEQTSLLRHEEEGSEHKFSRQVKDHEAGLNLISATLTDKKHGVISSLKEISAVGHRVVHGGESFSVSTIVNRKVIKAIEKFSSLAPLHNPPNLAGIKAVSHLMPETPQAAVFDTAFHQTMPPRAFLYALPHELYSKHHVRRYGFHGTSHRYIARRTAELIGKPAENLNLITAHLGNGCSMTAVRKGVSVDTTLGLTPLEGLVMGTRPGDVDPGIIIFLGEKLGMKISEINTMLNKKSGLLGISGVSNDIRDISEKARKGNRKAELALEIFSYRIKKYIGAYTAVLENVDAVAFSGGIGENAFFLRSSICSGMEALGIKIDERKNKKAAGKEALISSEKSGVKVFVVPTNEELMIARDAYAIVSRQIGNDGDINHGP